MLRVMSDAGPNVFISTWEKVSTLRKIARRRSRPRPIALRALKYTATIEVTPRTSVTRSISPPVWMMNAVSPLATPSLMISPLSVGR